MLMTAAALLETTPRPSDIANLRCARRRALPLHRLRKIIDAVTTATTANEAPALPDAGAAVGARIERLDGAPKVMGTEVYGADAWPRRAARPRHPQPASSRRLHSRRPRRLRPRHPGLVRVFTAADIPGENRFGVIPPLADQPALAETEARFKGEAVASSSASDEAVRVARPLAFPVTWEPLPPLLDIDAATAEGAPLVHINRAGNILVRGRVVRGDVDARLRARLHVTAEASFETGFVEHAYIEPEAGYAERQGDRITVAACTQAPYIDRDDTARILGVAPEQVRIVPTAVGGGFGSKLDLSVQPYVALAAWVTESAGAHGLHADRNRSCRRPSATRRGSASRIGGECAKASSPPSMSTAISTPAPTPPGGRRSPTACPCTPPAPTSCRTTAR